MRARARAIFADALTECSIPRAFSRHIRREAGVLQIGDNAYNLEGVRARAGGLDR